MGKFILLVWTYSSTNCLGDRRSENIHITWNLRSHTNRRLSDSLRCFCTLHRESTDKTLTITDAGNVQAAITVKGTAWDGVLGGSGVMLTGATHYSMTTGQAYGSKTALTGSDASITTLNPPQIRIVSGS